MPEPLRLLLLDDHAVFRDCLGRALDCEPDMKVEASCGNVEDALAALGERGIQVVLLDYDLGFERGTGFIRRAHAQKLSARIVVLTAWVGKADLAVLLACGVDAVVLKDKPLHDVIRIIRNLRPGSVYLDDRCRESVAEEEPPSADSPLTEREQRVLSMIVSGRSNKEIATQLHLSDTSVKATIQRLFGKAGVRTRGQLVGVALERYGRIV